MSLFSKIISALGLFLLIAIFLVALFGLGFALQVSGWGWVAIVAIFTLLGLTLYRVLK